MDVLFLPSIFKLIHKAAAGFRLEWGGEQLIQLATPLHQANPIAKLTQLVLLSVRTPPWGLGSGGALCSTHSLMWLQIPAVRFSTSHLSGGGRDSFDLLGARDPGLNAPSGDIQKPLTWPNVALLLTASQTLTHEKEMVRNSRLFSKYTSNDRAKEDNMGKACRMNCGRGECM
jgi:hypothetical protein